MDVNTIALPMPVWAKSLWHVFGGSSLVLPSFAVHECDPCVLTSLSSSTQTSSCICAKETMEPDFLSSSIILINHHSLEYIFTF